MPPIFRFPPVRPTVRRVAGIAPAAVFPTRTGNPAGTAKARGPFNMAALFHQSMVAQASRVPRLANLNAAIQQMRAAASNKRGGTRR